MILKVIQEAVFLQSSCPASLKMDRDLDTDAK